MAKDVALIVALPADLKVWIDEQAADMGLEAVTWVRMQLFQMRKRGTPTPTAPEAAAEPEGDPIDVGAMVAARLDEAVAEGVAEPVRERAVLPEGAVRSLRRPPVPFSPSTQPRHLAGFGE